MIVRSTPSSFRPPYHYVSHHPYTCIKLFSAVACGEPSLPNGAVVKNYTSDIHLNNGSFDFDCEPGYSVHGESEDGTVNVVCKANGRWSLNTLRCTRKYFHTQNSFTT